MRLEDIKAGRPHDGWQEAIDNFVAREPPYRRCADARDAWCDGAWTAVRGDPDPTTNCLCEWRRGYDWAVRRALAEAGWEAWNLAWREVDEGRPITRANVGGVRYYGSEHEVVPAEIAAHPAEGVALWKALHSISGSTMRWAVYRQLHPTDETLERAVSREFSSVTSGEVNGVSFWATGSKTDAGTGGLHPLFSYGNYGRDETIRGARLVSMARMLLSMPGADALTLLTVPEALPRTRRRGGVPEDRQSRTPSPDQLALI